MTLSVHVKKALKIAEPEATKARLSEGRQWIGIKNIEWLEQLQPRDGIDMEWARQLGTFRLEGSEFPPARVYQLPDGRLIAAGAFHRRIALLDLGESDILCEIVDGSMDDAIVYAAGSNKSNGVKPMTAKDTRKAIEMLFGIKEWWSRTNAAISNRVGCCNGTVGRVRAKYSVEHGIAIPTYVETSHGEKRRTTRNRPGSRDIFITVHDGPGLGDAKRRLFRSTYKGVTYTSMSQKELREKITAAFNAEDERRLCLRACRSKLATYEFKRFNWSVSNGFHGLFGHGIVVVICDFKEPTSLAAEIGNAKILCVAIGQLELALEERRTSTRKVVVCFKQDGPRKEIEMLEQAGYEFMTPDELIASLGPVIPEELKELGPSTQTD